MQRIAIVICLGLAALGATIPTPAGAQTALAPLVASQGYLRRGAEGPAVRALQAALNRLGAQLVVDGDFGPATAAAVRAFQRRAGLAVDGIVGPQTAAELDRRAGASSGGGIVGSLGGGGAGGAAEPDPSPAVPTATSSPARLTLPARPAGAPSGARVLEAMETLRRQGKSLAQREALVEQQVATGNVPRFLRRLRPVTLRGIGGDGRVHQLTVFVTPDYLSVGSDADFVRVPLTPKPAQRIADRLGCLLPTRKLVDAIHAQAQVRLAPQPMPPDGAMTWPARFLAHHRRIEERRLSTGAPLGGLVSGIKKDVVNTNRLRTRPNRVAIYGWHRSTGQPIQPLSLVHGDTYVDYSHGVRLVHGTARVDGQRRALAEVLRDPALAPLVSDEGPLYRARLPD